MPGVILETLAIGRNKLRHYIKFMVRQAPDFHYWELGVLSEKLIAYALSSTN
jgi:hypothetical protein